jgi:para-nitrobenzyl esterase
MVRQSILGSLLGSLFLAAALLPLVGCGSSGSGESGTGGAGGSRSSAARELLVQTTFGPVEGFDNEGVFSYRSIPYAAPPVGELRWKPPVAPAPWADTLATTERPNGCVQAPFNGLPIPGFVASEDCLYINVDTPTEGRDLPVMVWIHGGGFTLGEGVQADGGTAGDLIARQAGTVVVSMNYRLGQLGLLAHSALSAESATGASGNYGLMDQTAALRWVQQNIAAFGGDPENVTIFGESAGAFSVCGHLTSPKSAGLFHKAILQSGSCERPWSTLEAAEAQGDIFAEALGCAADEDLLACMRAKPAKEVIDTLPPGPNFGFNPSEGPSGSWWPILDGDFFTEQSTDAFASGNFNRVPTILGFTRDEARLFVWLGEIDQTAPLSITEQNYEAQIARLVGGDMELAARAAAEYPLEDFSEPAVALAEVATDVIFRCPGKQEIAKISEFVPAYLYQFEYPKVRSQLELAIQFEVLDAELPGYGLGAFHAADVPYVFGYSPILGFDLSDGIELILNEWDEDTADERVWLQMLGYFARFAATGDPNGDGAAEWPIYDAASDPHLVLDDPVRVASNAAGKCAFWSGEDYLKPGLFGN